MKVREIMTCDVQACGPETNLAEVVKLMWERDCGVLPVVKSDGKVFGMITDRDICVAIATRGRTADRIEARDVAAGKDLHVRPGRRGNRRSADDEIGRVRRLPVVDAEAG